MHTKVNKTKNKQSGLFRTKIVLLLASFFFYVSANAQCAMCRAAIESEGNVQKSEAVNDGIVYLMVIPYILVGTIGFIIYRMKTKKKVDSSQ